MFESAVPASVRRPCPPPASNPKIALGAAILGSSMAFLDGTVVNVALPVMQRDLGVSVDLTQWVVEAYALMLAALVLVGGALGDRFGRKRIFIAGVVLFAVASLLCGLAPNAISLVVARAIQGVGGAMLVPGSLALISAAYADEGARGAAIGTWSAFSAITAAVGPVGGGWVATHASWRWIFFFNLPIAALVVAITAAGVAETRDDTANQRLDIAGATLATLGLGLVVFALIDSEGRGGLSNARVIALLTAGIVALALFVVVEAKSRAPMMPLALFRSRTFAGTNLLTLLLYAALGGALFFVPFNLIQVQGYSPAAAGASLLPFVLAISTMSRWAGSVAARIGPRLPLVVGPMGAALGFALLAWPSIGGSYWRTFFPGIAVLGVGMGITVAPLTAAVMGSVDVRHAGVASGINNAVSRAAGLLAVAALGVLLLARFDSVLDARLASLSVSQDVARVVDAERSKLAAANLSGVTDPALQSALRAAFSDAFVAGFRALMWASAALSALSAVAGFALVKNHSER